MTTESWSQKSVAELIEEGVLAVGDGYRAKRQELADEGLPFARAGNIDAGFHFEDAELLGWPAIEKAGEKVSRPGDVVFTSKGTVGRFALVSEDTTRFVYSPQLCYWRSLSGQELDSRYLFYWMRSPAFLHQVGAVKGQTDMADYVSLRDQRRMLLTFPEPSIQRRIAAILGALDDKIELNRKMNRTLEEIAQTLFQAWFVDFEGETDLVESELGPIPRGWEIVNLAVVARLTKATIKPGEEAKEIWEHYSFPAFDENALPNRELGREIKSTKYKVPTNAILVSKLNPRIPRIWRVAPNLPDKAVCSTEFIPFVPLADGHRPYLFELLRSKPMEEAIQSRVTGTTGSRQRVRPGDLPGLPITKPKTDELILSFSAKVGPMHERLELNRRENKTLAEMRDTLLPKLISGEIRVPEAEDLVEEAV